jgi:hypothetical protein
MYSDIVENSNCGIVVVNSKRNGSSMLDQSFGFWNLYDVRSFDIDNILNALLAMMNIVPLLILRNKECILILLRIQTVVSLS